MDILDDFISTVDAMLDSRRKRHITGGILLSAALLFGGLAITVVTIQTDEEEYEDEENRFRYVYGWSHGRRRSNMALS